MRVEISQFYRKFLEMNERVGEAFGDMEIRWRK